MNRFCASVIALLAVGSYGLASAQQAPSESTAHYVGSQSCRNCHAPIYERWSHTRMANIVRDPRTHPGAIIPDLSKADPIVTFKLGDIALVYGSKWKQRYFTKIGDDYYPLGAQWEIAAGKWSRYFVPNTADWWAAFYPADNMKRPTGPTCDGCHSVNYDIKTKTVTEWNVGCERCHGPGSLHVKNPTRANTINPARLDPITGNDTCIQCHSQGRPLHNPIDGRYYDWPVGFQQGLHLKDFWNLEEFTPGKQTFTHYADGTAHKNRMQGNDFVTSEMYKHGITCFSCHDVHGTGNNADLLKPANVICLTCHGPKSPNGPHAATIEQHTHHRANSTGSDCVECHMPKIESEGVPGAMVRSHTFRFITPAETDDLKVPNPCTTCHVDKTTTWATEQLRSWPEFSPWRVGQ